MGKPLPLGPLVPFEPPTALQKPALLLVCYWYATNSHAPASVKIDDTGTCHVDSTITIPKYFERVALNEAEPKCHSADILDSRKYLRGDELPSHHQSPYVLRKPLRVAQKRHRRWSP